jgi:MFS family permease
MLAPRVLALGMVYFCAQTPLYSLGFFLPQIVKDFGLTNVQAGFVTALPYAIAAIGMVHYGRHSDKKLRTQVACCSAPSRSDWSTL